MKENTSISERLSQMIDYLHLNANEFAKNLKYNRSQAIYDILNGKSKPSFDFFQKLENSEYSEIFNYGWIIGGNGSMLKINEEDVSIFNKDRRTKDRIYEDQEVPLFDIEVAAGLRDILDNTKAQRILDMIRIPGLPRCDGALPATGDSMYPLLKAGDLVCFRRTSFESIFWGEMYILDLQIDEWDTILTVKFIQKSDKGDDYVKLVSQNQHHQPKDVKKNQIRAIAMVKATIRINSML